MKTLKTIISIIIIGATTLIAPLSSHAYVPTLEIGKSWNYTLQTCCIRHFEENIHDESDYDHLITYRIDSVEDFDCEQYFVMNSYLDGSSDVFLGMPVCWLKEDYDKKQIIFKRNKSYSAALWDYAEKNWNRRLIVTGIYAQDSYVLYDFENNNNGRYIVNEEPEITTYSSPIGELPALKFSQHWIVQGLGIVRPEADNDGIKMNSTYNFFYFYPSAINITTLHGNEENNDYYNDISNAPKKTLIGEPGYNKAYFQIISITLADGTVLYSSDDNYPLHLDPSVGAVSVSDYDINSYTIDVTPSSIVIKSAQNVKDVALYNMAGNLLHASSHSNESAISIPTAALPAGIYLLRINGTIHKVTLK